MRYEDSEVTGDSDRGRLAAEEAGQRSFWLPVAFIGLVGLAIRMGHLLVERSAPISGDATYYRLMAQSISRGDGFNPFAEPSAAHPPGWSLMLALADLIGLDSVFAYQVFAALIGTATVVLVGMAAREVAGIRAGVVGAGLAAVYPNLWIHERTLLSEVAVLPLVSVLVIASYRYLRDPRALFAAIMGLGIGLLALVRPEQLLLVPLLLLPLTLLVGRELAPLRQRAGRFLLGAALTVGVIAPWVAYNNGRFEERVVMSTNLGGTIWVANCPGTYEGELLGYVEESCWELAFLLQGDESAREAQMRERGIEYARDHLDRLPLVLAAREGRTWGLYRPFQQTRLDAEFSGGSRLPYQLALASYWLLLPAAATGLYVLRRRRTTVFVLVSFGVVVILATAVTLGQSRIRAAAEVPIVVLAAVALEDRLVRRRPPGTASASPAGAAPAE